MTGDTLQGLRKAAMLGTDRISEPVLADGDLGGVFRAIDAEKGTSPEGRAAALLSKLAVAAAYGRAGTQLGARKPIAGPEATEDSRPLLSRQGQRQLALLLREGPYAQLLAEWLEAAARHAIRPPARALPALLEAGRQHPGLRESILAGMGPRGAWLASHNEDWAYAAQSAMQVAEVPDPAALEVATHAERVIALRAWRRIDPVRARSWLEAALAKERARERTALIGTIEVALGPDDEPLLESRLDDRAKDVRALAARLLGRLPDSRLVRHMESRAAELVVWSVDREGVGDLVIELPKKLDDDVRRDGVEEQPAHRSGKRAWWLYQILAVVPPSRWTERWRAAAPEIVRAGLRTDWADLLVGAWAHAAALHHDAAWAEALLTERIGHEVDLWCCVPPERREPMLGRWLRRNSASVDLAKVVYEIRRIDGPWSEKFSRAVATSIRTMLEREAPPSSANMKEIGDACARRMAPGSHEAVRDILVRSMAPSGWTPMIEQMVELVGFRAAMLLEVQGTSAALRGVTSTLTR